MKPPSRFPFALSDASFPRKRPFAQMFLTLTGAILLLSVGVVSLLVLSAAALGAGAGLFPPFAAAR